MKNNKTLNVLLLLIWFVQLAVEALTAAMIVRLDMLPTKYLLVVLGALGLAWLVTGLLMLLKGRKNKVGTPRMVVGCVLALIVVVGCAAVSSVVSELHDTMTNISKPTVVKPTTVTMAVYVRQDDPAQSLADTKGYPYAYMDGYEADRTAKAMDALEKRLGEALNATGYTDLQVLTEDLAQGKAKALVLNKSYVELLAEMEGSEAFVQQLRLLQEVELVVETPVVGDDVNTPEVTDSPVYDPPKPKDITNTPFVFYISGSDTRSSNLVSVSNSDVNILVVVNPESKQILLLNTPRDYYISNPAGGGAMDKLTHCGYYGVECSMEVLGDLYDVDVNYYARINFTGLKTLVDAVGGVTVYSDAAFTALGGYYIEKGENYMDGDKALAFARERYHVAGGDNGRGKNQMKVIKALINKLTSGTTIISRYGEILDSLEGMFVTDLERSEINKLVKMQLNDMASWNIQTFAVTGEGDQRENYSMPGWGPVYVMYQDPELVAQASALVDKVVEGQLLTEEDVVPVH